MKKTWKIVALVLAFVVAIGATAAITVALLTDTDEAINVMTTGNVYIEQNEQERSGSELVAFKQAKPLLPAYYEATSTSDSIPYADATQWPVPGDEAWKILVDNENVVDKFVTVTNTGSTNAYVRTIIAYELDAVSGSDIHIVHNAATSPNPDVAAAFESTEYIENVIIDGVRYDLIVYTYAQPLAPRETTIPSLKQVYMDQFATNETVEAIGKTYDILVFSQAVQSEGFGTMTAGQALDAAFGDITADNNPWNTDGTTTNVPDVPEVVTYEDVAYLIREDSAEISSNGGTTVYRGVLSDGKGGVSEVTVGEGITTLGNRALCKEPGLTTVTLPSTLTYIDEGALQQTGITSIEIPENVTYVAKTALGACPDLETVIIKAKNVTFANYVARDCKSLKEVYIYSDTVTFESGSMYFTNAQTGDASSITFYVANQDVADALYNSSAATRSYGMLILSLDGATTYYDTLK